LDRTNLGVYLEGNAFKILAATYEIMLLEFLIPTYKRPAGAVLACSSIVRQLKPGQLGTVVSIRVRDDCSPGVDPLQLAGELRKLSPLIIFDRNEHNLGMSANIYSMVSTSRAEYCTVLTDDDTLNEDSLQDMLETLESFCGDPVGSRIRCVFTPRYAYSENGEFLFIDLQAFKQDTRISPSGANGLLLEHNGFILTGHIFAPAEVDYEAWEKSIDNVFFPVIYFALLVARKNSIFLNKKWFHHTVLNKCHWETWGSNEKEIERRHCRDYIDAIKSVYTTLAKEISLYKKIQLWFLKVYAISKYFNRTFRYLGYSLLFESKVKLDLSTILAFIYHIFYRTFILRDINYLDLAAKRLKHKNKVNL